MFMKKLLLMIPIIVLLAVSCNQGTTIPKIGTDVISNSLPNNYPENTANDNEVWDREKVTAIRELLSELNDYYKKNKKFPSQDELYNIVKIKHTKTLGEQYFNEDLQYYDYEGATPPRFLIFYTLSGLRNYAVGEGRLGGCGFEGCATYSLTEDNLPNIKALK
jgi:hypothetical protein